jgi:NADPH:quinone reductase-like Zn-dependent oxidoreductase
MMVTAQTMRAIRVYGYGGPEQLRLERTERPQPQAGEVLLHVYAVDVNPIDWKIRQGLMKDFMPLTFPYTPGIEVAGVVEAVGPAVTTCETGQAVFGQVARGAYAEYVTVPVEALALKPQSLSFEDVVQNVDLVLDGVGTETLRSSLAAPPSEKQAQERGVRALMIHSQPSGALLQTLVRLIDEGSIKAPVATTFPLNQAQQAHEYSQRRHGRGRIVLQIADGAASNVT